MASIRDEYTTTFGRQSLTVWSGAFASDYIASALELPKRNGFMVTLYDGRKIRVQCPAPRTEKNFHQVDDAISAAIAVANGKR